MYTFFIYVYVSIYNVYLYIFACVYIFLKENTIIFNKRFKFDVKTSGS